MSVSCLYLTVTFIDGSMATLETNYKQSLPENDVGNSVNKKAV